MQVRLASALPLELWDMRVRGNCWDRRDRVSDLAWERDQALEKDPARENVSKQVNFPRKDQVLVGALEQERGRV